MIFWHLGATIALIRYAFRDERMDLRFLAFGAVLPDLIDTPLGFVGWSEFQNVRLLAHSLLFGATLMVVVLLTTRRGRPRKRWMPVAIGVLVHLFLDAMWNQPETLWWPFLGLSFTTTGYETVADYLGWLLTDWKTWAGEAIGAAYLAYLWVNGGLGDPETRRAFFSTGRIGVPIDPA